MLQTKRILLLAALLLVFPFITEAGKPGYSYDDVISYHVELPGKIKCGVMQVSNGKWIILPQYDWIYDFEADNMAMVEVDGKWGLIDVSGKVIVAPRFESVGHFTEDLVAVKESGKVGFVDKSDKVVIEPQYQYVAGFSEGLCAVYVDEKWGFIDKTGKMVIEPQFSEVGGFSHGRAAVKVNNKWGFINKSGKLIIHPEYDRVNPFTEGLAAVQKDMRWGYINIEGIVEIPLKYYGHFGAWYFTEGLAAVHIDGKNGYIDGKYGYIDKTGTVIIPPLFDVAIPFREGRALIEIGGKWGFIDLKGNTIFPPELDKFAQRPAVFRNGFALVAYHQNLGVIDINGNWVVQPKEGVIKYFPRSKRVQMSRKDAGGIFTSYYFVDVNGNEIDHYANHMKEGYKCFKENNYSEAITAFKKALTINPGDHGALWGIRQAELELSK